MATKYLYKYITKGSDCSMIIVELEGIQDEVNSYADNRYISSCEVCQRFLYFDINDWIPPVMAWRIHLEDEQHMTFLDGEEEEALSQGQETELTVFFR